jgi:hypothetical protein
MTYPHRATYTPIPGKLSYPVLCHASRTMYGRHEHQISTLRDPDSRIWVTIGHNGSKLQFEEDQP